MKKNALEANAKGLKTNNGHMWHSLMKLPILLHKCKRIIAQWITQSLVS